MKPIQKFLIDYQGEEIFREGEINFIMPAVVKLLCLSCVTHLNHINSTQRYLP